MAKLFQRQQIEGLAGLLQVAAAHVRVQRRRAQRAVSQDLLNREQIDPGFQQFRGERVPQGVSAEAAFQAGPHFGSPQNGPHGLRGPPFAPGDRVRAEV